MSAPFNRIVVIAVLWTALVVLVPFEAQAQPGTVLSHQKISDTEGGFSGTLDDIDRFGFAVASLGDLDGDGVGDIAVGAYGDDDGGGDKDPAADHGAVWILFLNTDGTVKSHQKISDTQGGFTGILDDEDFFGWSVASLGDLDGDGVGDLAVGAINDNDGGKGFAARGAVWVLFLNTNGTVKAHQKISSTQGGGPPLDDGDHFGSSLASLGDLDGDGVGDLAVGAIGDDDGGNFRGAVWVLFLNSDGTVKSNQKISNTQGGFTGILDDGDSFGYSVAALGDLDGDGVGDLAVGANYDDDGGANRGAVWALFLNADGTVKSHQKISETEGGFTGILNDFDAFGISVASHGDLDGDGVSDLAVGAYFDGGAHGAVWVLFLNTNGTVKSHQKISDTQGGGPPLDAGDLFGVSVASLGDLDGDGIADLAVGAYRDDDGGVNRGAVWVLFLDGVACPLGFGDCETEPPLILFREENDSSWDWGGNGEIPGWDHVGFFHAGIVYEAHPGYSPGDYWDPLEEEFININISLRNVQTVHTLGSFLHDSTEQKTDATSIVAEIDFKIADALQTFIESQIGEPFQNPDCTVGGLLCMVANLAPAIQKHLEPDGNGVLSYTCIGLIERAAEEAGVNFGLGFIFPWLEMFGTGVGAISFPMLSPELLAFILDAEALPGETGSWFAGLLDPVDFMLTDPLGRRLGHTQELGTINEIPDSLFTGDGAVEQILILNPIPGEYLVELVGLGELAEAAFGGSIEGQLFQGFLDVGETAELVFVFPEPCPADLDGNGDVGVSDFLELLGVWGPCPPKGDCPADFDGNGDVGVSDFLELLGNWGPCP